MYIKRVELENFRNYNQFQLDFDKKLNIILGENAQGKTNLIESIYFSSAGKSFRTSKDKELINFNSSLCRITTEFVKDNEDCKIEIAINDKGKKGIKVDGVSIKKISELMENLLTVIFSPEDLKIIKEEPAKRRSFMDRELCQLKILYYNNLLNYKKTLNHRNNLLKNNNVDDTLLEVFDRELAKFGAGIIAERMKFVEKLNVISHQIHRDITNNKENIEIKYLSDIPVDQDRKIIENNFYEALKSARKNDMFRRTTTRGIQKDDLKVIVNNIDVRKFGSQGQQRTAALSLKLSEINLIKEEVGENPILILDDVMSELDSERQSYLLNSLANVQIFLTAAELSDEVKESLAGGKIVKIKKGNLLED